MDGTIIYCLGHFSRPEFTLEALPTMHSLLDARPAGFGSQEDAIEWQ